MKRVLLVFLIFVLQVISGGCLFEKYMISSQKIDTGSATARANAVLQTEDEDDEPLLLLDEPPAENPEDELKADNSRCHVCHINFSEEPFAVWHARGGVGCEKCHGKSNEHCADEKNTTAPDKMYGKKDINILCLEECHNPEYLPREQHREILMGTDREHKYCTDCHGEHRLEKRQYRWNKKTGELIGDN